MRTNYIYSIITKFFGNDMPKEVQLRFQHWFLQTEDSLEKEKALHKIWDGIEVKADEKTRRKYTKLNARIDLAEGNRKYFCSEADCGCRCHVPADVGIGLDGVEYERYAG